MALDWGDPDQDGLVNWLEDQYGTDRLNPDTDGDGITDGDEAYLLGTNPLAADSDGNGRSDWEDFYHSIHGLYPDEVQETDPNADVTEEAQAAAEKSPEVTESKVSTASPGYRPEDFAPWRNAFDSDGDGMTDVFELFYGLDPADPRDGADDPDGDFLTNLEESQAYTNPREYLTGGLERPRVVDLNNRTGKPRISSRTGKPVLRLAASDYEIVFQVELPPGLKRNNGPVKGHEWDDDWDGDGLDTFSELYLTQTDPRMPKGTEEESMRMETQDEPQPQQPQPQPQQPQPQPQPLQPQPQPQPLQPQPQPQPLQPQPQPLQPQPQPLQPQPQQPQPLPPQPQPPVLSWEVVGGSFDRITAYWNVQPNLGSIYYESASLHDVINGSRNWNTQNVPNVPNYGVLKNETEFPDEQEPDWPGTHPSFASSDVVFNSIKDHYADFQELHHDPITMSQPYPRLYETWKKKKIRLEISAPVATETSQTCLVVRRSWAAYSGGSGTYVDTVVGTHTFVIPATQTYSNGYMSADPSQPGEGGAVATYLIPVEILDKNKARASKLKVGKMSETGVLTGAETSASLDIDKDSDRFFIRVKGGVALGGVSVKVATTHNPVAAYNDDATQIDLVTDGADAISKSLLLVSDDVDDDHAVDNIADDATNDRTHKVQLGGNFTVMSVKVGSGAWLTALQSTPVPVEKTVTIGVVILRDGRDAQPMYQSDAGLN